MLKAEARKIYREKRTAISSPQKSKWDDLLLIQFQAVKLPFIHTLFTYWPIEENNEPDTSLFTGYIEFKNPALRVSYPLADFSNNTMQAMQVNADSVFTLNEHHIHEPVDGQPVHPTDIDMVGYRVGYGRGFYDKFLAQCRKDCIKAGFSYFEPIDKIEDRHEFDIPLDICITPGNVYVF
jgi:5-formyltetrahydrofolate cyclo-ligase